MTPHHFLNKRTQFFKTTLENGGGFTLIEVLVAVFVLAVGIVAVLQAFPLGTYIQKSSQMTTVAIQLSQAKLEELISKSYDDPLLSVSTTTESYGTVSDFSLYKRTTRINYYDPNNPFQIPVADLGIKKIEITVFWKSPLGVAEKEAKIATLFSQK